MQPSNPNFVRNAEADLFSIRSGSFSTEDTNRILTEAEARFQSAVEKGVAPETAWREIVIDFHQNSYWGYALNFGKPDAPKKVKTPEQVKATKVRQFLWTAVQSLVILKGVILYFGLNYAIESTNGYDGAWGQVDENRYRWGLAASVLISFGGLIWFAISQSRSNDWD